jgi:cell wall-associated NlpC family hydrolase
VQWSLVFFAFLWHDKIMKYFLCVLPFVLASCSAHLQQSSQAWDNDAPTVVRQKAFPRWQTASNPSDIKSSPSQTPPKSNGQNSAQNSPQNSALQPPAKPSVPRGRVSPPELGGFEFPGTAPERPPSGAAADILNTAQQYIGVPYVYGGHSPEKGFDCSGLVFYVFQQNGMSVQRTADKQFLQGQEVSSDQIQPGDLVFFSHSGKYVDHVGIYAGNDLFIHAPRTGRTVSYDSMSTGYYQSHFRGAKRFS